MFASQYLVLPVSFGVAQIRLTNLADNDGLNSASREAYEGELEQLIRVGPAGAVPGVSKLVRVRFLTPVFGDGTMAIGLRWEATGITGGLFPVLDANITLSRADADTTCLELTGSYRPPLGGVGAGLDRAILSRVAAATIRALLRDIARRLVDQPAADYLSEGGAPGLTPPAAEPQP